MNTRRTILAAVMASLMLTGCIVPGRHGQPTLLVPRLPKIVWLESEPYYVHGGYTYNYRDDGWYYSRQRSGPWVALPRDHYPRQVRVVEDDGGALAAKFKLDGHEVLSARGSDQPPHFG